MDEQSQSWHLFRSADVLRVLTDQATFSADPHLATSAEHDSQQAPHLATMDPPRHQQYRALLAPAFTPHALAPLVGRIAALVQERLAQVRPAGFLDLIADLAAPLSATVIAALLGLPDTDHPRFISWADALLACQVSDTELFQSSEEQHTRPVFQRADAASEEMNTYFSSLLADRRLPLRTNLLSTLLAAEVGGKRLSQEDILSFCSFLLLAGHATMTTLLGNAMLCLDAHPATVRELRRQPGLIANAREEVLRYASPVYRVLRVTRHAVDIANVTIPAHMRVFAWLASASRDEAYVPRPACFDIMRTPNRHLAFGYGPHFCLGASLARRVVAIILTTLLAQCPDLRVLSDQPLELLGSHLLFGVKRLPITLTLSPR